MMNSPSAGFIVRNLDLFEIKFKCLMCTWLLRDPVQLACGHRLCKICVQPQNNLVQCISCNEETDFSEIRLDKGFQKDMQLLEITCFCCDWIGFLKFYQDHLEKSHRQYKCSSCNDIFTSLSAMEEHIEKLCQKVPVNCILQPCGCDGQILRSDLGRHYLTEKHQRIISLRISQHNSSLCDQSKTSSIIETPIKMESTDEIHQMTTVLSTTSEKDEYDKESEHTSSIIDLFSNSIHTLMNELRRLNNDSREQSESCETTNLVLSTTKISVEESQNVLGAINTNLMILQQELTSLKHMFTEERIASYDGTFVWKISGFQKKLADAKSERVTSIYSPPFRSSPNGYKVCVRLYPFGDGNARRTHMSVFFVIMRSSDDGILHFPFNYKVTFCLFDQTSQQRHLIDSFRPDTKSNSFQRPRSNMNIASGIPKFAPLSIFETPDSPYIKDDTIFIKATIDFENMPKSILPYTVTLNPGLPTHVQQAMIQQEIERRTQQSELAVKPTIVDKNAKASDSYT